jgi:hypothetical protein
VNHHIVIRSKPLFLQFNCCHCKGDNVCTEPMRRFVRPKPYCSTSASELLCTIRVAIYGPRFDKPNHSDFGPGPFIYAAVDHIHDHVVQARGAFDETLLGVLALTAPRIVETCKWIARNLPFVDHVALIMGLENTGFAIANAEQLWIDPIDYQSELANAVDLLVSANTNVSVYNLQRCILDRSVWPYAAQSISDWKNGYMDECDRCIEKDRCSGFFTSGRPRPSRGINPVIAS